MPSRLCFDGNKLFVGEFKFSGRLLRYDLLQDPTLEANQTYATYAPITGTCTPEANVTLVVDATPIAPTAPCDHTGHFRITPQTPIHEGNHTLVVMQADQAGNYTDSGSPQEVTFVAPAPESNLTVELNTTSYRFVGQDGNFSLLITLQAPSNLDTSYPPMVVIGKQHAIQLHFDTTLSSLMGATLFNHAWDWQERAHAYILTYRGTATFGTTPMTLGITGTFAIPPQARGDTPLVITARYRTTEPNAKHSIAVQIIHYESNP